MFRNYEETDQSDFNFNMYVSYAYGLYTAHSAFRGRDQYGGGVYSCAHA